MERTALNQVIENLQGMRADLSKMNFTSDKAEESRVHEFIERADIYQRKAIIDALVCRESIVGGDASRLEDAAAQLQDEIDAQEAIANPPLCRQCNGSGEGMHEGTTCWACKGLGTVRHAA